MDARDEDVQQHRRQWACGVAAKGESLAADLAFWRAASASVKFAAIRAMADESVFAAHNVDYLVVGGSTVVFHARPLFTKDIDLWVAGTNRCGERCPWWRFSRMPFSACAHELGWCLSFRDQQRRPDRHQTGQRPSARSSRYRNTERSRRGRTLTRTAVAPTPARRRIGSSSDLACWGCGLSLELPSRWEFRNL